MKFSITQGGAIISSVYFNDNTIKEIVTFWTNVQYQSPEFALDLSPTTSSQLDQLYPNGLVPNISMSNHAIFDVLTDTPIISNINVIQLQLNFIGAPEPPEPDGTTSTKKWCDFFDDTTDWAITPANTAYVPTAVTPTHQIVLKPTASETPIEISYKVMISFQVEGEEKTYYAIVDPLAKVTNSAGEG